MKKLMLLILAFSMSIVSIQAQCNSSKTKAVKASYSEAEPDVVDIAISSKAHTTLVAAVKAAGLVETLKSDGPFTVFAPTNEAFDKLPEGTVNTLLQPENKDQLVKILTYHVISGKLEAKDVIAAIKKNDGKATLTTVSGDKISATMRNGKVILKDENGGYSTVTTTDLKGSNGVIHVIDTVVLPK
ncbi:MAG: fasciclin domain-containing protein [Bacteroidota bacterium]